MSTLVISDLSVLEDLNSQELKVAGAASAASAAATDWRDAVAASAATTDGYASASGNGGYRYSDYYGYYSESGPSAYASANDFHYYYY